MEDFESLDSGLNNTGVEPVLNISQCGHLDREKYETIQSCSFWVEGIGMSVLGFGAIITNFISIFVFSK